MLTLTRLQAHQVRAVFSRALAVSPRDLTTPLEFRGGPAGLSIRAQANDRAVEFLDPAPRPEASLWGTLGWLAAIESRQPAPLTLEPAAGGQVLARWLDRGLPCAHLGAAPRPPREPFPERPTAFVAQPPEFLAALDAACQTSDPQPTRFALDAIQFRGGSGTIAATDGRQVLQQTGFSFGWEDDLLLRRTTVFGCRELPRDRGPNLARTAGSLVFALGPWTIWLPLDGVGRFPNLDQVTPSAADRRAVLELAPGDRSFLAQALSRLPGVADPHQPLTLDLEGPCTVRARASGQPLTTELLLARSQRQGEPLRVVMDRCFLARAVELGFSRLEFFGPQQPVLARDERRLYLWALLDADSALPATADAVRIAAPEDTPARVPPQDSTTEPPRVARGSTKRAIRPEVRLDTPAGPAASNGGAAPVRTVGRKRRPPDDGPSPLEAAQELRQTLREAYGRAQTLVAALRRTQRQSRLTRAALASLRQLQNVA